MEPLGQSQVLAYLRGLSADYEVTVITFEKEVDLIDLARYQALRAECGALGIRWLPQRFRYQPRVVAPVLDMLRFCWLGWREVRKGAVLIHARSYIPGAVALLLHSVSRVPFIFDMRALWPEELITAGRLRRGSVMHRAITWVERRCLARGEVVSLTESAVGYLREVYSRELDGKRVHVIPTCADIERFAPGPGRQGAQVFGCNGTVLSGWFRFDWLATFFRVVAERDPGAMLEVVTRDDLSQVRERLVKKGVPTDRVDVYGVHASQMPEVVKHQTVAVMFYAGGAVSELGRSPTRMAEVLACGRPVIANAGVGDVAGIIGRYRVGVLVKDGSEEAMRVALDELSALQADSELAVRCRQAAEEVFSLKTGTEAYKAIYRSLCDRPGGRRSAFKLAK